MESPFEIADELAVTGKLGPEIAHTLLETYSLDETAQALRDLGFEVKLSYGHNAHLKGVSDYPKNHALYKPLPRPGTGELPLLEAVPTLVGAGALHEGAD